MNFSSLYMYAKRFEKLAQQDTYILYKKYVLDQFFNAFKNGKYTILYDTVNVESDQSSGSAGNIYGPNMIFDFVSKQNLPVEAVDTEVTTALKNSPLGDKIHNVNVEANGPMRFTCNIQFNTSISEIQ